MKAKAFFLLTVAVLSLSAITLLSCSKDVENDFDLSKGNLSGVWLREEGNGYARGYIFSSTMCEGEYTFSDQKDSRHSKHAVGRWYYNNVIYVANPYFVDRDKVYVNNKLTFYITDGNLIDLQGTIFVKQGADSGSQNETGNNDVLTPTREVNLMFIASSNSQAYRFIGDFVAISTFTRSAILDNLYLFRIDETGNIYMDAIEGKFSDGVLKTTLHEDYKSEPSWKVVSKDGNGFLYDAEGRHVLDVQCIDRETFHLQIPYGNAFELKKATQIIWDYDFSNYGHTPDEPFTVKEAIAKCKELGSTASENIFYVKGIISSINEVSLSYGNATFDISDNSDNTPENVITAYHIRDIGNKKFEKEDKIKVGDVVVMCGQLVNYKGNTPEIIQGYIFSLNSQTDGIPIDFGTHGDGTTR